MNADIFFDVICPWCLIGKRRLDQALAERPDIVLRRRWLPFQLNPGMPKGGVDRKTYLAAKFGGPERAAQFYGLIAETAASDGLDIDLDRIERTPSTLDAHRLIRLADAEGPGAEPAVEALFHAYFKEGADIGRREVLRDIGASLGMDGQRVSAYLTSPSDVEVVKTSDAAARQMGIQAVPCFVFDGRYALSGAQEPQAFFPLFDLALSTAALAQASS